jgi:chromosome segregation ATPase
VKQHLDDEQKGKFDKLIEDRFNLSRWGGGGGGGGTPTPGGGGRDGRSRRPSVDERVKRVMESLKVETAEDAAAIRDLVKKCVEAQYALEDYDQEARKQVEDLSKKTDASEDDLKTRIDEIRGGRREKDKTLKDCQKSLAEVVTYRQELELIKSGILR